MSNTSVDEIVRVIEVLQQRPTGSLAMFENVLAEICEYLQQITTYCTRHQMRQGAGSDSIESADVGARIAEALANIKINAPPVNVELASPNVIVQMPDPVAASMKAWTFDVTQRDELGRIRQFRASPEN